MANIYADRVRETSTTTGTGTYNLDGAVTGFETFVAGVATTNTCFYCVEDGTDWEVGQGTVTDAAPDTLSRDTILASSNSDAAVSWGAGTKKVFLVVPSDVLTLIAGRNVIINGNFDIWQRGTSFVPIAHAEYGTDRWIWIQSGAGVVSQLRSTTVPDNTSDFSLQIDVTTIDAAIAAADHYLQEYIVEGYDAMRFGFGTSDATQLTLSFRARSSKTGIHCVAFQNSARNRSFVVEYTIAVADTYENFSITLTADTAGTWLTDNGIGLRVMWALAVGATQQGAAGSWNAADDRATSNQVNVMDNIANNFHISRVQLELGSVATAFERRAFAQELGLCQRYYTKTFNIGAAPIQAGGSAGSRTAISAGTAVGTVAYMWEFPVVMRAAPTVTTYNPARANADWNRNGTDIAAITAVLSEGSGKIFNNATTLDGNIHEIHAQADAEL